MWILLHVVQTINGAGKALTASMRLPLQLVSLDARPPAPPQIHLIAVSNKADHPAMLEMIHIASRFGMHATVLTFRSDEYLMSKLRVRWPSP